jgi:hypothetical protein
LVVEELVEEVLKTMDQILLYVHLQFKQQLVVDMELIQEVPVVGVMLVLRLVEVLQQHVKVMLVEIVHQTQALLEIIIEVVAEVELVELVQQEEVVIQLVELVELVKQTQ